MAKIEIPAFKVQIYDVTNGNKLLDEKKFTDGPGSENDVLNVQYEPNQTWSHVLVRRKGNDGEAQVTTRHRGSDKQLVPVQPGENVFESGGHTFKVVISALPRTEWKFGEKAAFQAPSVEISSDARGWYVTFTPREKPCVLTCAVSANTVKDENLPSVPFPADLSCQSGRIHIPVGQFRAEVGGEVRLGVRGAGMQAVVCLPPLGETVTVSPEMFQVAGAAQPEFLTSAYVQGKFNERPASVSYF